MKKKRKWPNKRGYELLSKLAQDAYDILLSLPEEDLKALIKAAGELTQANCGWQSYHMAPGLVELARAALDWRQRQDKEADNA